MGDIIHIEFARKPAPPKTKGMGRIDAMSDEALQAMFDCFSGETDRSETTSILCEQAAVELARRGIDVHATSRGPGNGPA